MSETNGQGVNYSVKELLAKIEGKLDGVIITIGQKAEKHDVERLDERVAERFRLQDARLAALESSDTGSRAVRDFFRWAIPVFVVVAVAAATHYFG